jgi:ankyrin repeat protein
MYSFDSFKLPLVFGFNSFSEALIDHKPLGNGGFNRDLSRLLTAIEFQKEMLVRFLVENGADVNAQGGVYGSALSAPEAQGEYSIVRFLLENGVTRSSKDGG